MKPVRSAMTHQMSFAALALTLILPGSLWATVINIPGGNSGTLQSAINSASEGDILELAAGTFTAPAGGFLITNPGVSFTIRAATGSNVFLDGGGSQPVLRYLVDNPSLRGHVIFEDLTFRNGVSATDGTVGGVSMSDAYATFRGCTFFNNAVFGGNGAGGALGLFSASRATISDTVFDQNLARNGGAAIRVGTDSVAWIHRSQFLDNSTAIPGHRPSSTGGAIDVSDATLWVSNSRFVGNRAGFVGGAIWALGTFTDPNSVPRTEVIIANSTFDSNLAQPNTGISTPSPTEGGAVHAENQTRVRIFNSRFIANSAQLGGALSSYRAIIEVDDSVFEDNLTFFPGNVGGFGGTIKVTSNDANDSTTNNGAINRPSAVFTLRDSLVRGLGGTTDTALKGGCLFAQGDTNRTFGNNPNVPPMGNGSVNRTEINIFDTVFDDCDVDFKSTSTGSGVGGALNLTHVDLNLQGSLFTNCDATGTNGEGGAIRALTDSLVFISDTTFAKNSAERFGGALEILGSDVTIDQCTFIENDVSPGFIEPDSQSFGAAIYAAPLLNLFGSFDIEVTGTVSNSLFSNNTGLDIWDRDQAAGPINDVRYNSNTFFNDSYGDLVYRDNIQGPAVDASGLNALVITRNGGVPSTDKSQVANSQLTTPAVTGAILAVPPQIHSNAASGEPGPTLSYLGYAWSGASATVDGASVSGNTGLQTATAGTHTLNVGGQTFQDSLTSGAVPSLSLSASPVSINGGDSSTLSWSSNAAFLGFGMDQGLDVSGPSGSTLVSPTQSTTYTACLMTQQGGDVETVRVFVDEVGVEFLFTDGFESGNTSGWDTSVP